MSGFDKYICPVCRGTGEMVRAKPIEQTDACFVLHRQHGVYLRCLRADAGYARMCDQPYAGVLNVPDGRCPIAAREDQERAEDPWIQAQVILRNAGRNGLDALKKEEGKP